MLFQNVVILLLKLMPIKITLKITLNLKILKKQLILAKFSSKKKLLIK